MNKAYILHSRFGLDIKEYKSGKCVKTYISSKRNSGFGGPGDSDESGEDEDAGEDVDNSSRGAFNKMIQIRKQKKNDRLNQKRKEFTLDKLSKLQNYVVDNFETNMSGDNPSKDFRDASFILLYFTPLLSKIPKISKISKNGNKFGERERKRSRRGQESDETAAAEATLQAQMPPPLQDLTKIIADINAARAAPSPPPSTSKTIIDYILELDPEGPRIKIRKGSSDPRKIHKSDDRVAAISRLGGDDYNLLKDFIVYLRDERRVQNVVVDIIEAANDARPGVSGGSLVRNHSCRGNLQLRSPHGVCSDRKTIKNNRDLDPLPVADDTPYGINFLEVEALSPPHHGRRGEDKFGFYKRCYLCGLKWRILPEENTPVRAQHPYRKTQPSDGGEPKEAEHVHAISHLAELILRISYIYFARRAGDVEGFQRINLPAGVTVDREKKLFLTNITKFAKMFGGFYNTTATEMFMFVDSCAYCNKKKSNTSFINLNVPPHAELEWQGQQIDVNRRGIIELLNNIWVGVEPNNTPPITKAFVTQQGKITGANRLEWLNTLTNKQNMDRLAALNDEADIQQRYKTDGVKHPHSPLGVSGTHQEHGVYATYDAIVERYKAIIHRIQQRANEILSFVPLADFGKILIPVKRYGVQRVNISRLKKRFTDKEIRFIKKHII